jgi:hypothetical protein
VEEPVKPETARGIRRLLPRRKQSGRSDPTAKVRPPSAPEGEFDPVEFAEFLEADDGPIPIDPEFKEQLRERLWRIVRERAERSRRASRRPRKPSRTRLLD